MSVLPSAHGGFIVYDTVFLGARRRMLYNMGLSSRGSSRRRAWDLRVARPAQPPPGGAEELMNYDRTLIKSFCFATEKRHVNCETWQCVVYCVRIRSRMCCHSVRSRVIRAPGDYAGQADNLHRSKQRRGMTLGGSDKSRVSLGKPLLPSACRF